MSIINWTTRTLKLELSLNPDCIQNISIHGLSRYSLRKIGPTEKWDFKVLLFPQFIGIHKLNGLIAKDKYSGNVYYLNEGDSDIVFEVAMRKEKIEGLFENAEEAEEVEEVDEGPSQEEMIDA